MPTDVASVAAVDNGPAGSPPAMPVEHDLRLVLDHVPHLAWVVGSHGTLEYCNRRAREYIGQDARVYRGSPWHWLELIHPDDVERVSSVWAESVGSEREFALDIRIRRVDGRFRWHRACGVPVRDGRDRIVRWVGTCTDVEANKALEGELRRAQRETAETVTLLETLLAGAPVGFGFGDREFRVLRVNETLAATCGVPADQQSGRLLPDVLPGFWPFIEPHYRHVLETGESVQRISVAADSDANQTQSFAVSCYPVRVDGEVIGVGFVVVDITDRQQAEVFRSVVLDNMAEGLYTTDGEGNITSSNRAAAQMLGWHEDEMLGRSIFDFLQTSHPDGAAFRGSDGPVARVVTDGEELAVTEGTYVRKDGSTFPVAYSAVPLRVGPDITGMVVVFRDIAEQRQQEHREVQARHDQKLESLGRLSAGLAHEINTPIQFVGDNTRFLAEAYQQMLELLLVYRYCMGPDSGHLPWQERRQRVQVAEDKADIDYLAAEVPSAVDQSLEGIDRVASLVRAMKAFSYKDSNDRAYADLNEAIRTTVTVARNEVKYVAEVVLDLGDLPEVLCHIGDLNQVFLNLLVNSADAMQDRPQRGEIRITTRADGSDVVIRFADNGSGIPEHLLKTIFEPFFTTKDVGKGTGQGLALARAVCDKHGGSIEVSSQFGEGTEFVLRLPAAGYQGESA